jgi:hypothetical protein
MSRWSASQKKTSYLGEMIKHRYNMYGALTSLAAASVLSIPFGFGVALLPLLGYAAGTSIAALFVPTSRRFRDIVDRKKRSAAREAARTHLIGEIERRVDKGHHYWNSYHRLLERRDSLKQVAEQGDSAISLDDIERLDDTTVDFLGVWLGRIAISERERTFDDDDVKRRIKRIDAEIEEVKDEGNKRRLTKARADLKALLKRRREMRTREASAEAQMLSICDTFDELYQRIMAAPTSQEAASQLRMSVEHLNIEEELDHVLHEEVDAMLEGNQEVEEAS